MRSALITGVSGEALTADEAAFLREARPAGLILFSRNCRNATQVRALIESFKSAAKSDAVLVAIDQEGGRVERLKPPLAHQVPPAAAFGQLAQRDPADACDAATAAARLIAADLAALGITMNCAPVLDVPVPGAHAIIGDRAYGEEPWLVVSLGRAVASGLLAGGVVPVMKHIPGHGRATKDSHFDLPVVTASRAELSAHDFVPFQKLSDLPAAMTAHVVFTAVDDAAPASISPAVTGSIIREEIGFDGLLMSDDLSMRALSGSLRERAEAVIRAGSDLALHCNGDLAEMAAVAAGVPPLAGKALARFEAALALTGRAEAFDTAEAEARLGRVLAIQAASAESV